MLECVCSHSSHMHTKYTTAKLQPNVFTYDPWCDVGNIQLPFSVSVTKKEIFEDYFKYFYHEIEKDTENENKTSNIRQKQNQQWKQKKDYKQKLHPKKFFTELLSVHEICCITGIFL